MLSMIADWIKSIATIISFLVIVALLVIVGAQVLWPTPTIESISAPESVQKWGYAPDVLAQKISAETRRIARNAERDFDVAYPRQWVGIQTVEAKIPGSDFTVRSAAQFISALLNRPSKRVTGEITKIDNSFEVTLRISGGESLSTKIISNNDRADSDNIVMKASEIVMQLTHPYVLAASLYNAERGDISSNFAKTISLLDYMIENKKELYYAHNLKCNVFLRLYKIEAAERECNQAIQIDPANWPAQANLGYLYYELATKGINWKTGVATEEAKKNCQKATEQFNKAERKHPLRFLYGNWARCLEVLGKPEEANRLRRRSEE